MVAQNTKNIKKGGKSPEYWLKATDRLSRSFNLASRDLQEILDIVLQGLKKELNASAVAVWTLEEDADFMKIEASSGLGKEYIRYFNKTDRLKVGVGLVGSVMVQKKTLYTLDVLSEKKFAEIPRWRDMVLESGFNTVIAAPMFVGKKVVGAFVIYYKKPKVSLDPFELQFIEILTNHVAVTIENIEGYDVVKSYSKGLAEQVEKLAGLHKVTESLALVKTTGSKRSIKPFAEYIFKRFKADGLSIFQYNPVEKQMSLEIAYNISANHQKYLAENPFPIEKGTLAGLAFEEKSPKTSPKVFVDERIKKKWRTLLSIEHKSAIVAIPLIVRDEILGAVVIYYPSVHTFSEDEINTYAILARYIGISLLNTRTIASLETEQQKLAHMINSLHDGLVVYDKEGKIKSINKSAEELLWLSSTDIIDRHPDSLPSHKNIIYGNIQFISSLELSNFESREITIASPVNKIFKITLVPLVGEKGKRSGSMRVIHDLTVERETEMLQRGFVTVASHQLRTPLTQIKWMLAAALEKDFGQISPELEEQIKNSSISIDKLVDIIRDILDVSQLEERRYELKLTKFNTEDLIKEIIKSAGPDIKHGGLKVSIKKPKGPLPQVTTDRKKLHMALENIIDNAIKYTKEGGSVTVSLEIEKKQKKSIIISVADSGIGMSKGDLKHLFTKFYRSEGAIRVRPNGSGLGLFIAKEIISLINGKIWAESEENKGSIFHVMLPLDQPTRKLKRTNRRKK